MRYNGLAVREAANDTEPLAGSVIESPNRGSPEEDAVSWLHFWPVLLLCYAALSLPRLKLIQAGLSERA